MLLRVTGTSPIRITLHIFYWFILGGFDTDDTRVVLAATNFVFVLCFGSILGHVRGTMTRELFRGTLHPLLLMVDGCLLVTVNSLFGYSVHTFYLDTVECLTSRYLDR